MSKDQKRGNREAKKPKQPVRGAIEPGLIKAATPQVAASKTKS